MALMTKQGDLKNVRGNLEEYYSEVMTTYPQIGQKVVTVIRSLLSGDMKVDEIARFYEQDNPNLFLSTESFSTRRDILKEDQLIQNGISKIADQDILHIIKLLLKNSQLDIVEAKLKQFKAKSSIQIIPENYSITPALESRFQQMEKSINDKFIHENEAVLKYLQSLEGRILSQHRILSQSLDEFKSENQWILARNHPTVKKKEAGTWKKEEFE
eukprot:TRINITY_DN378_c0_g2_i3.p1 TRINITY_DN378_c0_g2~~TRINITY_DN378_c0_g2_i3.p1  ORF type:complete len:214 (-),score=26.44 TRINITY_DN378_c0_g2_i3:157-798(-)